MEEPTSIPFFAPVVNKTSGEATNLRNKTYASLVAADKELGLSTTNVMIRVENDLYYRPTAGMTNGEGWEKIYSESQVKAYVQSQLSKVPGAIYANEAAVKNAVLDAQTLFQIAIVPGQTPDDTSVYLKLQGVTFGLQLADLSNQ